MKQALLMFLLFTSITCIAQTSYQADIIHAKQTLKVAGKSITAIDNDTALRAKSATTLPTQYAVYEYVKNRENDNAARLSNKINYQKSYWPSLADFTASGFTPTINSVNQLHFSGGTADFSKPLIINGLTTSDENTDIEVTFRLDTTLSYGLAVGKKSINIWYNATLAVQVDFTTGLMNMWDANATSVIASQIIGTLPSIGDVVQITYSQVANSVTGVYKNITTGYVAAPFTITDNLAASKNFKIPNTSDVCIWNLSGKMTIYSIKAVSKTKQKPLICFIGDSKSFGYSSTFKGLRFADLCSKLGTVAVFAGDGDRTTEAAYSAPKIAALKPKYAILCIGRNDIQYDEQHGISTPSWPANYRSIVDTLQAAGVTVLHLLPPPETVTDASSLASWIVANYPGAYIDDISGWSNSLYLSSDNVHPNTAGHAFIANKIISSGLIASDSSNYDVIPVRIDNNQGVYALSGMTPNQVQKAGASTTLSSSSIFDDGNNVGVGTTSPYSFGTGLRTFEVYGSTAGVFKFSNANPTSYYFSSYLDRMYLASINGTTQLNWMAINQGTGAIGLGGSDPWASPQLSVTATSVSVASLSSGAVYSNAGTLTNTNPSDRRLKHLIKPVRYGLKEILHLKPVSFYYNSDSTNGLKQFGFIAQDVKNIMPDAVRPINPNSKYLGLEKDAIYSTLINAVKELQQQIDALKKQILPLKK